MAVVACLIDVSTALADNEAVGEEIYLIELGMPSVFTFDQVSMLCSVYWGKVGALGATKISQMKRTTRGGFRCLITSC